MLITIIFRLVALSTFAGHPSLEEVAPPRVAQVRLAEMLSDADAIHAVHARGRQAKFAITRGDESLQVTVTTTKKGDITALAIAPGDGIAYELGGLSWLSEELASATAVTKLVVDEDGAVTITTNDGRRYMVIPGRGSGGSNTAVEARWAAEWSQQQEI